MSLQTGKIRLDEHGGVSICFVFEIGFRSAAQDRLELGMLSPTPQKLSVGIIGSHHHV